ncbi:MAG: molybdate ABC transporter permease subunit [Bacteriovoracaceae bacterium]|nr:molybdate ABC transporter permease subunit [Bacteriovoracaceae bacterium]
MDWESIFLTLKLATMSTLILLIICIPVGYWLATIRSPLKPFVSAVFALPLVLPPTVLGFYLLMAFGSNGPIGKLTSFLDIEGFAFSFKGLVLGSIIYSFPFVLGPIQNSFESVSDKYSEVAMSLGAPLKDTLFKVSIPLAKPGIIAGAVLGFAHTIGEFGVVLMIGGNIPGKTKVLSVSIYDHVEALEYSKAHSLSAGLLIFSFVILIFIYGLGNKWRIGK